jgi:hypothetical protein
VESTSIHGSSCGYSLRYSFRWSWAVTTLSDTAPNDNPTRADPLECGLNESGGTASGRSWIRQVGVAWKDKNRCTTLLGGKELKSSFLIGFRNGADGGQCTAGMPANGPNLSREGPRVSGMDGSSGEVENASRGRS